MIVRNAIRCNHCGKVLESTHVHDFKVHRCEKAGMISQEYDHGLGKYVPAMPYMAVDGGLDYIRRLGDPKDWTELNEFEEDE